MHLFTKLVILLTIINCALTLPLDYDYAEVEERFDNIEERGPYFEGDLDLSESEILKIRSGIIDPAKRWPNRTVTYKISDAFDEDRKDIIRNATRLVSDRTCIVFRELEGSETAADYVEVVNVASGCSSQVGKRGGRQTINLEFACLNRPGTVAHEFIHAIGFYHEQSRTDRDDFVTIVWDNIQAGKEHNFDLHTASEVSPFEVPYDYGSVMHYSEYGFANDTQQRTIVPKFEYEGQIGQRVALSESDALKLNHMYNC